MLEMAETEMQSDKCEWREWHHISNSYVPFIGLNSLQSKSDYKNTKEILQIQYYIQEKYCLK